jgi:hypothetical protein
MNRFFYSFLLLFCLSGTWAQEKELEIMAPFILEGEWTGKLTQISGGIAREYNYDIKISLQDSLISGKASLKSGSNYAYFDIKGKYKGSAVDLEDLRISNELIPSRSAWCIKKMPLKLKFLNGVFLLEGPWTGTSTLKPCTPGMIYLWKATVRA